jgi:tetratricopeptide (TPR) repeat protein
MEKAWQLDTITTTEKKRAAPPPPRFDQDLRHFLEDQEGVLIILSEDALFIKTVRTGVLRALQIKRNCTESFHDPAVAMSAIRDRVRVRTPVMALVDRLLAGKPNMDFLRTVKQLYPALKLIVMTHETTKDTLALLLELGVDHVITKPVSVDTLIEKMARVLKPQSKINQLIQEARDCLDQKDFDKVFKVCDSIFEMKEKCAVARMLRGEVFMKQGNRPGAVEEFEKAHEVSPQYLEPLKRLVDVNKDLDDGKYLNYMLLLDEISPLNVERKFEIAKCYTRRQDPVQAKEFFDKAIACAQEEAKRYLCAIIAEVGQAALESSPELAGNYFAQYFELKGGELSREDMIAFNNYGIALRKQGKWSEALENYGQALKVDPEDLRILYNCALAHAEGAQHAKAIALFAKVLAKDPQFHRAAASISYNIALSYYQLKDMENARKYLLVALQVEPEHANSKLLLASLPKVP